MSGRKSIFQKPQRTNTTLCSSSSGGSVKKKLLNTTQRLNETTLIRHNLTSKLKPGMLFEAYDYETDVDLAYNDYLEALMKQEIVQKQISKLKGILTGQISFQSEVLSERRQNYEELLSKTESFEKQGEVLEVVDFLQKHIDVLTALYAKYSMKDNLIKIQDVLDRECDKVFLRRVKVFNQEDCNKLLSLLQEIMLQVEKIINSGRNFEGVDKLANNIRSFVEKKDAVEELIKKGQKLEEDGFYKLLNSMSDFFAKQYDI